MSGLTRLVQEAHRRSLWKVLGMYGVASWVVLQVVDSLTQSAGLPDWTPGFSLVLLLIGFPVVMATAFVQEGGPGLTRDPEKTPALAPGTDDGISPPGTDTDTLDRPGTRPASMTNARPAAIKNFLTWKFALGGGIGAALLLAAAVGAYFFMWSTGIGAIGSLEAQGVFEKGEVVVLAEFENTTDNESLGTLITETLRIDLANSPNLNVANPASVSRTLGLMGRPENTRLTSDIAREVALREGIKAVIQGSVGSAGDGYVLLATIRAASDGVALASFRRTARSRADLIDAIDGLSQDIREKAGESLRSIKTEERLAAVTTSSLPALELYVRANQIISQDGDWERGISLLEDAVTLDPGFAMAYRKMGALMGNAGRSSAEQAEATLRAYQLRERLTERERGLATADYHRSVAGDRTAAIEAFERVLERYPDDGAALNNLSLEYFVYGRYQDAVELLDRAVSGPGASRVAHSNLVRAKRNMRDTTGTREARELFHSRHPIRSSTDGYTDWIYWMSRGDGPAAHAAGIEFSDATGVAAGAVLGSAMAALVDMLRGRVDEADRHLTEAEEYLSQETSPEALANAVVTHGVIDLLGGHTDRARGRLVRALEEGLFDRVEADQRSWLAWIGTLIWAGDLATAEDLLARAAREMSPITAVWSAEIQEWGAAMLAGADDPRVGLEKLIRLRSRRRCDACYGVDVALLADAGGDYRRAVAEYERLYWSGSDEEIFRGALPLALRRLGPLHEELGNTESAIEWYNRIVTWYVDAEPSQQSIAAEARARVATLIGGGVLEPNAPLEPDT